MYPGQMVTTFTPADLNSPRKLSQYEMMAALLGQVAPWPGRPRMPFTLPMPTKVPDPRADIGAMNG